MGARVFCTGEQESAPYWRQSLPNLFVSRIRMGNLLCCSGILTSLPPETHEAEPPASSRSSYSFEKRLWATPRRSSAKGTRIPCVLLCYYLADRGTDLRTMQDYLGHRDPRHTVHYTRVSGRRFEGLWK